MSKARGFTTALASRSASGAAHRQLTADFNLGEGKEGIGALTLSELARHILRHVADSVVVCTAHSQKAKPAVSTTPGDTLVPVGLTMSSFAPLTLVPTPVITFNIAVPSRTEQVIAKTRNFMIHILAGDAQGARLADVFRQGNAHPASTLRALRQTSSNIVWPGGVPGHHQDDDQPFLQGKGVLYVLRCRLLDEPLDGLVPVRDHVVVLGEVLEIIKGDAELTTSTGTPCFGLLYGDRHYRCLSEDVVRTGIEDQS
ncbi:hypothetical protein SEPCBS57363_004795 [Sporothrix epigloea]|uniref:Flavin reductase like domain-containing protein n=1 Tax=Sporothrix epigloea TaxID=1892477 RepID=A0ABP0DXV3_9PEZI